MYLHLFAEASEEPDSVPEDDNVHRTCHTLPEVSKTEGFIWEKIVLLTLNVMFCGIHLQALAAGQHNALPNQIRASVNSW